MKITRDLRLPVLVAPMFLVSGVEMVVAAAHAGILGAFPTPNCRTPAELDDWMNQINARVEGRPWAVNLITHSTNARLGDDLAILEKYQPAMVITALGSPAPVVARVHAYGGMVMADVPDPALAKKALAAGADGLACLATGAGGHTGHLSPFAFISAVRAFHRGPLSIGGGISDGEGVAAAIAAGADIACMGTRFLGASESLASDEYKQAVVAASIGDIVASDRVTGTTALWLRESLAAAGYLDPDTADAARDYGSANDAHRRWRDIWSAGQAVGSVRAIEPVAEIVDQLDTAFRKAAARLQS
ncbi:nitronate monooxygenase family protein [Blastomonas sp.]|uniref:NAD(P)H-dependent flavin oxidoreductase n=1 Tax=Blastomonas sp. TaxID=1909299 RepID=UPI002632D2A6|nr:nitronate monooxygenase [Blastomonas sp.]MDM7955111.1 nitronate monooxygenase [Blastomonas sp.]